MDREQSRLSLALFILCIQALFGLAAKGKGRAGYDLMSLRKKRADRRPLLDAKQTLVGIKLKC